MTNPNVQGYFSGPSLPPAAQGPMTPPASPGAAYVSTPAYPGQAPVTTWETWVPTSAADPYVAGMRTSASALAAFRNVNSVAVGARFEVAKALKMGGARVSASAARFSGRTSRATALPKGMKAASSVAQKTQYTQGIQAGVGSAFRHTFLSVGNVARAIGSSALVAIPMALVTNLLDFAAGKITEQQRNALIVADAAGYTATGATATLVGGFVGSTFLGPAIGTVIGIGAGFALGWLYEKYIRPQWGEWVRGAMYAAPTPTPVPDYPPPK
ncbi:MAG: hypothetical protein VKP62_08205 [Candidatus Sericytochromatia bacterium]|nr:hypothetical protein [Candidatus Sericytochromatia bacterium]